MLDIQIYLSLLSVWLSFIWTQDSSSALEKKNAVPHVTRGCVVSV